MSRHRQHESTLSVRTLNQPFGNTGTIVARRLNAAYFMPDTKRPWHFCSGGTNAPGAESALRCAEASSVPTTVELPPAAWARFVLSRHLSS